MTEKILHDDFFHVNILGDKWTFYVVEDNDDVIADEHSDAETDWENHQIYFRRSQINLPTVKHEVWHLYFSYTYTQTANLDAHQAEEVSAELYAYRGDDMDKKSQEILEKLIEIRDRK